MAKISDLKGFVYPSPTGVASCVGDLPWHYGTEHLCVTYRSDPDVIASYLPEPLQPARESDLVMIDFGKWYCLWNDPDLPVTNPERTWYQETLIFVGCSFEGQESRYCLQSWVSTDFSLLRGYIMGFNKKIGETYKTTYHAMNPGMPELGPGVAMSGFVASHGERLMEGHLLIDDEIPYDQLPPLLRGPQVNLRFFPSMVVGAPPAVCELLKLEVTNIRTGRAFAGSGRIKLLPSALEEHTNLVVREELGAYYFENGYTITGGKVLHSWV
jgi:acetoacetate decarboxylase